MLTFNQTTFVNFYKKKSSKNLLTQSFIFHHYYHLVLLTLTSCWSSSPMGHRFYPDPIYIYIYRIYDIYIYISWCIWKKVTKNPQIITKLQNLGVTTCSLNTHWPKFSHFWCLQMPFKDCTSKLRHRSKVKLLIASSYLKKAVSCHIWPCLSTMRFMGWTIHVQSWRVLKRQTIRDSLRQLLHQMSPSLNPISFSLFNLVLKTTSQQLFSFKAFRNLHGYQPMADSGGLFKCHSFWRKMGTAMTPTNPAEVRIRRRSSPSKKPPCGPVFFPNLWLFGWHLYRKMPVLVENGISWATGG